MTSAAELTHLRATLVDIGVSSASPSDRAAAVLIALGDRVRFDVGSIMFRDPERQRHIAVATTGPANSLRDYLARGDADREVDGLGLTVNRPPMLASQLPVPIPQIAAWADHFLPAGFREGLVASLFTSTGRHVGLLGMLVYDAARLTMVERAVIARVSTLVAEVLDRTHDIAAATRLVTAAAEGVVLTTAGRVLPLPGLSSGRLLDAGSPVVRMAAAEVQQYPGSFTTFVAEYGGVDGTGLVRASVLPCARSDLDHLAAAVLVGPAPDLQGLTPLQLRVLGCLANGIRSVPAIAVTLAEGSADVALALEHALATLHAADRAEAAVRAIRAGLRIPPG